MFLRSEGREATAGKGGEAQVGRIGAIEAAQLGDQGWRGREGLGEGNACGVVGDGGGAGGGLQEGVTIIRRTGINGEPADGFIGMDPSSSGSCLQLN